MRGALRTSRTRGGMRWTQVARETHAPDAYGEVAWFGRRGAGAKLAIRSAGDGGKRAVLREEREVSRKAIAQGRPGCSACTCMLVCAFLVRNCTRDRGCSVHPVFPAPSDFRGGQQTMQNSGERCREKAKLYPRHCERSDAIHLFACCAMDCFWSLSSGAHSRDPLARNDVERPQRTGCPVCTGTAAFRAAHRLHNTIFSCTAFIKQEHDQSVITICSFGTQIAASDSTKLFLLVGRGLQWR